MICKHINLNQDDGSGKLYLIIHTMWSPLLNSNILTQSVVVDFWGAPCCHLVHFPANDSCCYGFNIEIRFAESLTFVFSILWVITQSLPNGTQSLQIVTPSDPKVSQLIPFGARARRFGHDFRRLGHQGTCRHTGQLW